MKDLAKSALSGVVVSVMLMGPALAAETRHTTARATGPDDHRKIAHSRPGRHYVVQTQRLRHSPAAQPAAGHVASRSAPTHTAAFVNDSPAATEEHHGGLASQIGLASWYGGPRWHGKPTSSGGTYDQDALTAAHASLPLGSRVRVTLVDSDRTVVVTINDRPGTRRRIIDLSRGAARELGILERGVAMVTLTRL